MITAGQLQGMPVRTEAGGKLGRVSEIHVRDGEVTSLVCGPSGLLQRFTASRRGRRVAWKRILRIEANEIVARD